MLRTFPDFRQHLGLTEPSVAELQVQQVQQVGAVGASGFLWDLMFFFGDFMGSFHGISTWTWGNFMDHSHAMLMDVNGC